MPGRKKIRAHSYYLGCLRLVQVEISVPYARYWLTSRVWGFSSLHICHSYMDLKAHISGLQTLHYLLCLHWLL